MLITNSKDSTLKEKLRLFSFKADRIDIAVAFFSDTELLRHWENKMKKINLIVSLRPPTNYYSLNDLKSSVNIGMNFLGKDFHSKFIIFHRQKEIIGAVIGSSNFTSHGLEKNIETNIFIQDPEILSELKDHFNELLKESNLLQPTDLDKYKIVYDDWLSRQKKEEIALKRFETNITKNRAKRNQKISKEAIQFKEYWGIVDEIKDLIKNISDKNYPNIPYYFAIDHFWHYIKNYWYEREGITLTKSNQRKEIPKIFNEYIKWHRDEEKQNSPKWALNQSKNIFQVYLSEKNIDKLSRPQAKEIFQCLHSTAIPIKRFQADVKFIKKNSIKQIRASLKYLLYSNDDIETRIDNLIKNPKYKLHRLGASGVQEINGWTKPTIFPIRNKKSDRAIEILGYSFS